MTAFQVHMPPMGKARPRVTRTGHAFMPEPYRKWKKEFGRLAKLALKSETLPLFPKGVRIRVDTVFFTKTGNCQSDTDNAHASVLDALQDAGIIVNDRDVKAGSFDIASSPMGDDYIHISIQPRPDRL